MLPFSVIVGQQPKFLQHCEEIHLKGSFHMLMETYPVSMAFGIALVGSEKRCIAALSIKANLKEGWGRKSESQSSRKSPWGHKLSIKSTTTSDISTRDEKQALCPYNEFSLVHVHVSHQAIATLGAGHDQAWVQSVTLCVLLLLPMFVHMSSHAVDLLIAHSDCAFYPNSSVLNGLEGWRQTLDFPTFSIPGRQSSLINFRHRKRHKMLKF